MLLAMTTHTSSPRPSVRFAALVHRWPSAVGVLAAAGLFLAGADRVSVALVVAIAATCYVAAAAFSLPWMAWAWIPLSFVVVLAGVPCRARPARVDGRQPRPCSSSSGSCGVRSGRR